MSTEEIIRKWLDSENEKAGWAAAWARDEGDGTWTLDGIFNIRNLALLLDERKVGWGQVPPQRGSEHI